MNGHYGGSQKFRGGKLQVPSCHVGIINHADTATTVVEWHCGN